MHQIPELRVRQDASCMGTIQGAVRFHGGIGLLAALTAEHDVQKSEQAAAEARGEQPVLTDIQRLDLKIQQRIEQQLQESIEEEQKQASRVGAAAVEQQREVTAAQAAPAEAAPAEADESKFYDDFHAMLKQVRKEEFERTGQTSAALSSSEYDRAHAHENALIAMMVARRRLKRPGHWAEESNVTVAEVRAMLKDPAERASLDAELALLVERTRPSFNILNQPDSEHSLTPIQMIVELTWHAGQSYPDRSIDSVSGLLGQEAMAMHAQQVINAIGYDLIDTTAFHASSGQSLLHVSSVRGHHTFVGLILDYVDSAQFAVDQAASSREVDVRRAIIYRSANTLDNAARNLADHRLHGVHEAIGQKSEVTRLRLALRDPQTLSLDITPEQMHTELARFLSKHPLLHFSRSGMRKINSCHLCQTHIKPVLATRAVSACCTQLLRPPAARRQTLACHDALCRFALASHLCVCVGCSLSPVVWWCRWKAHGRRCLSPRVSRRARRPLAHSTIRARRATPVPSRKIRLTR